MHKKGTLVFLSSSSVALALPGFQQAFTVSIEKSLDRDQKNFSYLAASIFLLIYLFSSQNGLNTWKVKR